MSEAIENKINGENLTEEVYSAALCLVSWKYLKLDKKSAVTLNRLKRKFLKGKDKRKQGKPSSVIDRRRGRRRIRVRNPIISDDYQPPAIPPVPALAGLIGECSKPCQKRLTMTDLQAHQTRLSLNNNHVREFMLPLLEEDEKVRHGIPVITYDSEGREYQMRFKLWPPKMYVLTTRGWTTFYTRHRLVKDIDFVTYWMFRHRVTNRLCFAITWRRIN